MRLMLRTIYLIVLLLLLPTFALAGGLPEANPPEGVSGAGELTICTEPRPQMCTRDYRPVCATLKDGTFKTYSNGCTACTDPAVTEHREGACGE